jgi:hypothetical protein
MKREQIADRIEDIDEELEKGVWTASGQLELRAIQANLEIALALARIADVMEITNGKSN